MVDSDSAAFTGAMAMEVADMRPSCLSTRPRKSAHRRHEHDATGPPEYRFATLPGWLSTLVQTHSAPRPPPFSTTLTTTWLGGIKKAYKTLSTAQTTQRERGAHVPGRELRGPAAEGPLGDHRGVLCYVAQSVGEKCWPNVTLKACVWLPVWPNVTPRPVNGFQ